MFFIEIIATHQLIDIAKVSDAIAVSKTRDSQQREAATIAVNANIGVKVLTLPRQTVMLVFHNLELNFAFSPDSLTNVQQDQHFPQCIGINL
jgi:hypothetical protein